MDATNGKMSPNIAPPWKKALLKIRVRVLLLVAGASAVFFYLTVLLYLYATNDCNSAIYTKFICDKYHRGVVNGDLCARLCDQGQLHRIYLGQCLSSGPQYEVFYWKERVNGKDAELEIKVSTSHLEHMGSKKTERVPFSQPARGTSMDQFRQMVLQFVDEKIGAGEHRDLVDKIIDVADVNKDQKISLAEAKSIWALLQHNEFFVSLVFSDSEYVPQLKGFCGDLYAVEYHQRKHLFHKKPNSYLSKVFPEHYKWGFPFWEHRARVAVGLLEFTMEAFQHGSDGTYHMCSLSEETIGYSAQYDVKISDASQILSQQEVGSFLAEVTCSSDDDCQYSPVCSSSCNRATGKCSSEVSFPMLFHVCDILRDYLYSGMSASVAQEFAALLSRCEKLGLHTEVEHSLVLNDLKSLLWKQISYRRMR